jgi:hypothetical protein
MTLIVEDGTVVAGAESYIAVAAADTYHANQGNTAWALISTTALKEQALRRAMTYLTSEYRDRWAGSRTSITQPLDWPRYMVPLQDVPGGYSSYPAFVSSTIVPTEAQRAQAELALRATVADLAPDLTRGVLSETIGPIKTEYDPNGVLFTVYRSIDKLLKPLLRDGGGTSVRLVRS